MSVKEFLQRIITYSEPASETQTTTVGNLLAYNHGITLTHGASNRLVIRDFGDLRWPMPKYVDCNGFWVKLVLTNPKNVNENPIYEVFVAKRRDIPNALPLRRVPKGTLQNRFRY